MTKKIDIGLELLESAVICYMDSKYFSALHLGGAAEEIFGKYVRASGNTDALTQFARAIHDLGLSEGEELPIKSNKKYLSFAKNSVKHMDSIKDEKFYFDARVEARDIIERAITNSNLLRINPTNTILKYYAFEADSRQRAD